MRAQVERARVGRHHRQLQSAAGQSIWQDNFLGIKDLGNDYCNSCNVCVARVLSILSYVNVKVLLNMTEKVCCGCILPARAKKQEAVGRTLRLYTNLISPFLSR